ncbi:MAG: response regulator [Lysobacterales bacterium]
MSSNNASGDATFRRMLQARITQLAMQAQTTLDDAWAPDRVEQLRTSFAETSDIATRFKLDEVAHACRDTGAYLGFLLDGAEPPNDAERQRLNEFLELLAHQALELAAQLQREENTRAAVLYVRPPDRDIPGLQAQLRQQGWRALIEADRDGVAQVVDDQTLVGVVVDSSLLPQLGEIIDTIDQARKPGPTPPVLVVTLEGSITDQLLGMTGSTDAFIANADAAGVVRKLVELQHTLSSTEPLRVLIVDDDRTQIVFYDAVLRRRGITTRVATSSREALGVVQTFRPDLMLVNLNMPEIDGMALTARVREMPGTLLLPIVFVSGEQDVDKRTRAINVGADDFLTRPVQPAHLIDVVVGRAKRARALRRQVLSGPLAAPTGPLARSLLALRIRDLGDRPAALISVGLENAKALTEKLPSLLRCEMEQAISGRIAARLGAGDSFGPWDEFHFLVLAARNSEGELHQLAQNLRQGIDVRPVVVSRGQIKVQARVELCAALPDAQRWLDLALGLWARGGKTEGASQSAPATPAPKKESPAAGNPVTHPQLALCVAEYQPLIMVRGAVTDQWQQRLRLRPGPQQPATLGRDNYYEQALHAGTLARLDRMALRLALDSIVVQRKRGRQLRIQVEVALPTIIDPGFFPYLEDECRKSGLTRGSGELTLELDTDAVIEQLTTVRPVLDRLRTLGVHLCLRHFGLQKEALRLLQQINVDAVKLDTDLALQPSLAFTSMLAHVRDGGVPIEVEDVPDRLTITRLWELGTDYIQCEQLRGYSESLEFEFQATVG